MDKRNQGPKRKKQVSYNKIMHVPMPEKTPRNGRGMWGSIPFCVLAVSNAEIQGGGGAAEEIINMK